MKPSPFVLIPGPVRRWPLVFAVLLVAACGETAEPGPSPDEALADWPDEVAAMMPDGVSLLESATCVTIVRLAWRDERIEPLWDDAISLVQYDAQRRPLMHHQYDPRALLVMPEPFERFTPAVRGDLETLAAWRTVLGLDDRDNSTEFLDLFSHDDGAEVARRLLRDDDGAFVPYSTTTLRADALGRMLAADITFDGSPWVSETRWLRDELGRPTEVQIEGRTRRTWTWSDQDGQSTFTDGVGSCEQRWADGLLVEQTCNLFGERGPQRTEEITYADDGTMHRLDSYDPTASQRQITSFIFAPSAAAWDVADLPERRGILYQERQRDSEGRVVSTETGWRHPDGFSASTPAYRHQHEWFCR